MWLKFNLSTEFKWFTIVGAIMGNSTYWVSVPEWHEGDYQLHIYDVESTTVERLPDIQKLKKKLKVHF